MGKKFIPVGRTIVTSRNVGKRIASSKRMVQWGIFCEGKERVIMLKHSLLTGKKEIYIDQALKFETKDSVFSSDFRHVEAVDGHTFIIEVTGNPTSFQYNLIADGTTYPLLPQMTRDDIEKYYKRQKGKKGKGKSKKDESTESESESESESKSESESDSRSSESSKSSSKSDKKKVKKHKKRKESGSDSESKSETDESSSDSDRKLKIHRKASVPVLKLSKSKKSKKTKIEKKKSANEVLVDPNQYDPFAGGNETPEPVIEQPELFMPRSQSYVEPATFETYKPSAPLFDLPQGEILQDQSIEDMLSHMSLVPDQQILNYLDNSQQTNYQEQPQQLQQSQNQLTEEYDSPYNDVFDVQSFSKKYSGPAKKAGGDIARKNLAKPIVTSGIFASMNKTVDEFGVPVVPQQQAMNRTSAMDVAFGHPSMMGTIPMGAPNMMGGMTMSNPNMMGGMNMSNPNMMGGNNPYAMQQNQSYNQFGY